MDKKLRLGFRDVLLDEARFELRRGGRPVDIQPKALELILYLARHRERVVRKDELLATVWGGVAVTEASLNQALSLARRALGDTGEAQTTIRTVRSKGFQFIAHEETLREVEPRVMKSCAGGANTTMETAQALDDSKRREPMSDSPRLTAAFHCEDPSLGGASWSLAELDEVEVGRGSERRSQRIEGLTRLLRIAVPGRLMSRVHARLCRTPQGWLLVDAGARNGTLVDGRRVDKVLLSPGDFFECGGSLFLFSHETTNASPNATPDADSDSLADALLPSVYPEIATMNHALHRVATTDLPVLLLGERGVGKATIAASMHAISQRHGRLVRLDARALPEDFVASPLTSVAVSEARGGALLVRNVESLSTVAAAHVAALLDEATDVRWLSTSTLSAPELTERLGSELLARLSGYRVALPALRLRIGDLGVLVTRMLEELGARLRFDADAARLMVSWSWPGNLRELAHRLKLLAALSEGRVRADLIPAEMHEPRGVEALQRNEKAKEGATSRR